MMGMKSKVFWASAAMALALVLGVGVRGAQAQTAVLYPYLSTEAGVFTFVTLLNDGCSMPLGTAASYHFTYAMKPVPVVNKKGCEHFDGDAGSSFADVMNFEVNKKVDLITAMGDTTSTPFYYPLLGRVGFLIVEGIDDCEFFHGWAVVVNAATGLHYAYSSHDLRGSPTIDPSFVGLDAGSDFKFTSWYPASLVTTTWYVLPLGLRSAMAPGGGGGIRRGLTTYTDHIPASGLAGAYDINEHFFSGGKQVPIRCLGFMTRPDFLMPAVVASTDGGGWTSFFSVAITLPLTDPDDPGGPYVTGNYLLYKIQSTTALGGVKTTVSREPVH